VKTICFDRKRKAGGGLTAAIAVAAKSRGVGRSKYIVGTFEKKIKEKRESKTVKK